MVDLEPRTEAGKALTALMTIRESWHPIDGRRDRLLVDILAIEEQAATEAERDVTKALEERDAYMDWADKLAYSIAPVEVIGEHSNMNDPWQNAIEHLEGERQAATEARRELLAKVEELPRFFVNSAPDADRPMVRADAGVWLAITDVLRLIEESDRG